jgi:hypothetical protein
VWSIRKHEWQLQNDLTGDPSGALLRFVNRATDGPTLRYVFEFLAVRATHIWILAVVAVATIGVCSARRLNIHPGAHIAAATAAFYSAGLYVAYLSTPLGLTFHLGTSAARTMAVAVIALLVSIFFLLADLERIVWQGAGPTISTSAQAQSHPV